MDALVTRGLTKRYGGVAAVERLDLAVEEGTLFGFLGPNGAGKTTTIRMLLGLVFPTEGGVEVLEQPVFGVPEPRTAAALRQVGALVEEPAAWKWLSGRRNLEYLARAAGPAADRVARVARVDEMLRIVGLEEAASKKVKAYSQGMRQRLGIAAAMLGAPRVLILDEPTNGLDPSGMREVRVLLRRLADDGTTVFVSSHLLWEVEAMCDRVGVLARGRLVAEGTPTSLRRPAGHLRIRVDDLGRAERVLASIAGVAPAPDGEPRRADATLIVRLQPPATPAGVNAALVSAGVGVEALIPEEASLEDVFLALVDGAGSDASGAPLRGASTGERADDDREGSDVPG